MEDKRITKTKRALKSALLELLTTQAFDVISITELCKIANVSRITFYTHYKDKFALLDDIFNDMLIIGKEGYHRRQEENNPENNLTQGYLNVLDSILSLYYERYDFFRHVVPETNPYLAFRFYRILLDTVESLKDMLKASYSLGATRYETIKVVVRQIAPGIATATLLSIGRAIGDAAAVLFTAGYTDNIPTSLGQPAATLPLAVFFQLSSPIPAVQERAYAAALILTIIVLILSILGRIITNRFSRNKIQ